MGNSSSFEVNTPQLQPTSYRHNTEFTQDNVGFEETGVRFSLPEIDETGSNNDETRETISLPDIPETDNAQDRKCDDCESREVIPNQYGTNISSGAVQKDETLAESTVSVTRSSSPDVVLCIQKHDPEIVSDSDLRHRSVKRHFSFGDKPHHLKDSHANSDIPPIERFLIGRADFRKKTSKKILITEVAPSNSSIYEDDPNKWKMPLHNFSSKKMDIGQEYKHKSRRIRSYYKAQNSLITSFEEIQMGVNDEMDNIEALKKLRQACIFYSKLSFGINLLLLVGKAVASVLSGSMSIISSLVDSSVDLLSGVILWWAARAAKSRDPYVYPQGRTKLEPIAVIIISVVMTVASLQLVRESIEKAIGLSNGTSSMPDIDITTFVISGCTVVFKFVLWLLCRRYKTSALQTLALDHRNDVASNLVAIVCGYLGSTGMLKTTGISEFKYFDPVGAIIISFYIVYNWWKVGADQVKLLSGHTAHPDFLSKLTWICINHHKEISQIESVRAFHFGTNFLVEVDIVLPKNMTLREAHDIGEPLQQKLENLPEVERAFVHVDYDVTHHPSMEHKIV